MQYRFNLLICGALVAIGCGSSGTPRGPEAQESHAAPATHTAADACLHLEKLIKDADPYAEPNRTDCQSSLSHDVAIWDPKVGEAVLQCVLHSADLETIQGSCSFGTIAKSLGLGLRQTNLRVTDACLSLREKRRRERPDASFDGPACEKEIMEELGAWQPEVVQAVLACIVAGSSFERARDCSPRPFARQLGLSHPLASKTKEAVDNLVRIGDAVEAYYAAHSKLPGAIPATPSKDCCSRGGQCQANAASWTTSAWNALSFGLETPHYYSYELEIGEPAHGNAGSFTIKATGDLDCDGEKSTYTLYGEIRDGTLQRAGDVLKQQPYE